MQIIPLQPLPAQVISVQLGDQDCEIWVYQKSFGLYLDLYVSNTPIILGQLCENLNRLVRSAYLGFIGDLMFGDTQGTNDPDYTGLGGRFQLTWLETADIGTV